jgi:hypothetical protein
MKECRPHNARVPIATAGRVCIGRLRRVVFDGRPRPDPPHRGLPEATSLGDASLYSSYCYASLVGPVGEKPAG